MATSLNIEARVAILESELARVKQQLKLADNPKNDWLNAVSGSFANDTVYDKAMRLGKQYRDSLRPKISTTGKAKVGKRMATKKRS
jgi:hypothetical protein